MQKIGKINGFVSNLEKKSPAALKSVDFSIILRNKYRNLQNFCNMEQMLRMWQAQMNLTRLFMLIYSLANRHLHHWISGGIGAVVQRAIRTAPVAQRQPGRPCFARLDQTPEHFSLPRKILFLSHVQLLDQIAT